MRSDYLVLRSVSPSGEPVWTRLTQHPMLPINLLAMTAVGKSYAVYTEDENTNAALPSLGIATTAFAQAYVDVVIYAEESGTVHPWDRNLTPEELWIIGSPHRYVLPWFWNAFLLGAYEELQNHDGDPDTQIYYAGSTTAINGDRLYSAVYFEALRDYYATRSFTWEPGRLAAHELGHQFELGHTAGVMHSDPLNYGSGVFTPADLDAIRRSSRP